MTCVFGFGHVVRGAVLAAAAALALGAAQAQETVKIGFIGPMSGGDAQQGLSARNGFQIAVDQANSRACLSRSSRSSSMTPPIRRPGVARRSN